MICALRASRAQRRQDYEMAVFAAWRTATLMRARKIPHLPSLLRRRKRICASEQDRIRAEVAAAEATFARLDAEVRAREEVTHG